MVQTVTKKGKTNEASMLHIVKETLRHAILLEEGEQCVFTVDGAPAHVHACVALAFKNAKLWLYITAPNCTPYIQACDKKNDQWGIQILFGGELCRVDGRSIDVEKKETRAHPRPFPRGNRYVGSGGIRCHHIG